MCNPRQKLREELLELIEPWKTGYAEPPFTPEELVVMGMVFHPETGTTTEEVQVWIVQSFAYYTNLALASTKLALLLAVGEATKKDGAKIFLDFQRQCRLVYGRFEVPIERIDYSWNFRIDTSAARVFLQSTLRTLDPQEEAPQQAFPFLQLPAELRNRIYELVLQYPKSGLCVKSRHPDAKALKKVPAHFIVIRDEDCPVGEIDSTAFNLSHDEEYLRSWSDLPPVSPDVKHSRPAVECLSLLQVNKQIYKEAMPVFFSTNRFIFPHIWHLLAFLEDTPTIRQNHIECIGFRFSPRARPELDEHLATRAFTLLKQIPHLRELDIKVSEQSWIRARNDRPHLFQYLDVLKIPGVDILRSIRGLEAVRFHDDVQSDLWQFIPNDFKTLQTLVPEMTQPREKEKESLEKRKASHEGGDLAVGKTEGSGLSEVVDDMAKATKAKKIKIG